MDCCKIILVAINVIFMLFGLAILGTGIAFIVSFNAYKDALVDHSGNFDLSNAGTTFGIGACVFGAFILLIAALGCIGACCNNKCLLVTYAIVVIILLIAEIGVVIYVVVEGQKAADNINTGFLLAMKDYKEDNSDDKSKAFSTIFQTLGCCGVSNISDFTTNRITWVKTHPAVPYVQNFPVSCCKNVANYESVTASTYQDHLECLTLGTDATTYREGCVTKIENYIMQYRGVAIGVGVAILLVELLTVIAAFTVCRSSEDKYA